MITPFRPDDIAPYYPAVVDIETASDGKLLAIEYGYTNEHNSRIYHTFDNWGDFVRLLRTLVNTYKTDRQQLHKITRIWAHNGANFDYLNLIEYIRDNDLAKDVQYIINGSMGIGVVIKLKSKETIRLYDSYRLLPASLDALGKEFNTSSKKLTIEKKYKSKMEKFLVDHKDLFYEYLHNDVVSLQEVIYKFWCMIYELEGSIGHLPMTLPALALKIFRKGLDDDTAITVPWNDEVRTFTRRAYTGGRVECAQSGEHSGIKVYDVNSMYPAVMRANVYPASARSAWIYQYRTDLLGFYEIEYNQTNTAIPAVLRDETTGKFQHTGSGVYTTSEIELLKEMGADITVKQGLVFQRSVKLFEKFVDKYYNLRVAAQKANNSALSFVCKILMNSLYGKFGQAGVKQQIEQVKNSRIAEVIANGGSVHVLSEDYMVVMESDIVEHEFVAIAAYVTSYARILLYRAILSCGDNYVYSDTDSVHCVNILLPTSSELGAMKLETSGTGIYLGPKLYSIKSRKGVKLKAKGIGRATRQGLVTHSAFRRLLEPDTSLTVEFRVFPTVKEVLSKSRPSCLMFTRARTIRRIS